MNTFLKYWKRPFSLSLLFIAIMASGPLSLMDMPVKLYPNVVKPSLRLGFGHFEIGRPIDLYNDLGKSIESEIESLEGLDHYTISYYFGSARAKLYFKWEVDEMEVSRKMESFLNNVKAQQDNLFWFNIRTSSSESSGRIFVAISHDKESKQSLEENVTETLIPQIKKITGVQSASLYGRVFQRATISLDRSKMLHHKITVESLRNKINSAIETQNAGTLRETSAGKGRDIIVEALASEMEDLMKIEIISEADKGRRVLLSEIAELEEVRRPRDELYRLNGKAANILDIGPKGDADTWRVCAKIIQTIEDWKNQSAGAKFAVLVNPADFIKEAIINLFTNALIGGIMAILVLLFMLRQPKAAFIITLSIPFCLVTSFTLMSLADISVNIISLGGLAIGVGMILDSSIVALENMARHFSNERPKSFHDKALLAIKSIKEVGPPILASTLTSVVVFLPIIYTASYTQAILGDLAKTIIFILLLSVPAAIIIVPLLGLHLLKDGDSQTSNKQGIGGRLYLRTLSFSLKSKKHAVITILILCILPATAPFLFPKLKQEIMSTPSTALVDIYTQLHDNEDITLTQKYANKIESLLKKNSALDFFVTMFWSPERGYVTARMKNKDSFDQIEETIKKAFPTSAEAEITVEKWDPGGLPLPRQNDMYIDVQGPSEEVMAEASKMIIAESTKHKASAWRSPWNSSRSFINMNFNSWISPRLKNQSISEVKASTFDGLRLSPIQTKGKTRRPYLRYKTSKIAKNIDDLSRTPLLTNKKIIPLSSVAKIKIKDAKYIPIRRANAQASQRVTLNLQEKDGVDKKDALKKMRSSIEKIKLPKGVSLVFPEASPEIKKSFSSFKLALILSVALVFLVMALMFNSARYPALILSSIPFAFSGVILGLWTADISLNLNSMLGTILLCGLVVNNAILFIEFFLENKEKSGLDGALILAAELRFRPIMMTTLTTLLGMAPLALGLGESGEILRPLGVAIFSGLFFSTAITLYFIPSFLKITERP